MIIRGRDAIYKIRTSTVLEDLPTTILLVLEELTMVEPRKKKLIETVKIIKKVFTVFSRFPN